MYVRRRISETNLNMVTKWPAVVVVVARLSFIVIVLYCFVDSSAQPCTNDFELCKECQDGDTITIKYCTSPSCERIDENFIDLENRINKLLSTKLKTKYLTLVNVPLRNLTSAVCQLTELVNLELSHNCLEAVPVGCFKDFRSIEKIRITDNKVNVLKKGVFDGLGSLKYVEMERNRISHIDEEVFSNKSDLSKLTHINFEYNKLISVGAWIFMWPNSLQEELRIDLSDNYISKFTNSFNWTFDCKNKVISKLDFELNLSKNNISHINDLIKPYFKKRVDLLCMLGKKLVDISIRLRNNNLLCDCVDFQFAVLAQNAAYSSVMENVQCKRPVEFQDRKLLSIALDDLVCKSTTNCIQGCLCIEQPSKSTFHVNCSQSYQHDAFPESLPKTKLHKFNLNFGKTTLERLEKRKYFSNTAYLDLSNARIKSISDEFLTSIKHVGVVHLHGNLLSTLPRKASQNETFLIKELTLYNNPWNCDCENQWLKSWINKSRRMIKLPESMYCKEPHWNRGKSILSVEDSDFCIDPNVVKHNRTLMMVLIPVFASILLIIGVGTLAWKFKVEIHAKFRIHPFDRDECEGEHMLYDVFISSSYQDRALAIDLVKTLESRGYCVCYHEKDFLSGETIASNICRAIFYSKRVVCIVSDNFLKSPFCMYEFQVTLHRNIEIKKNRLIALLSNSMNPNKEVMTDDMFSFLSSHTYVKMTEENKWLNQLCYSLAVNQIRRADFDCSLLGGLESELIPQSYGDISPTDEPSLSGLYSL